MAWHKPKPADSGGGENTSFDNEILTREGLKTISKQIASADEFNELEVFEVMDIYRDEGNPRISSPGEVVGRYIHSEIDDSVKDLLTFKPLNSNILQQPIVGELWLGINLEGRRYYIGQVNEDVNDVNFEKFNESSPGGKENNDTIKVSDAVLNSNKNVEDYTQGNYFEDTNPTKLIPFEGDTIIQGRFGNTIRLGSNQEDLEKDEYVDSPNIKIVAGTQGAEENLETDLSSLYLTTGEYVDYSEPSLSFIERDYDLPQLVGDSDRIVLNAKSDVVAVFAQKDIRLNSIDGDVLIQAKDKIEFKPENSQIINNILNGGMILNKTKDGIPFGQLDMIGFLKQVMGLQLFLKGMTLGVPKLSNPLTLPLGVKEIVKGLKGAEDFITATLGLEFISKSLMETKTIEEIKAVLPIPGGFAGIIDDVSNITDEQIKKLEELEKAAGEQIQKASELQNALNGAPPNVSGVQSLLADGSFDNFDGVADLKSVIDGASDEDLERYINNGGLSSFENQVSEQSSIIGSADTARSYQSLFKTKGVSDG